MKEIPAIIQAFNSLSRNEDAALATVIHVDGSSYRRPGARLLVSASGQWTGGISGGCLEGDALLKAQRAIAQQRASTVIYDTREDDEHQIGVGLGCQGRIELLISPFPERGNPKHPIAVWQNILQARTPQWLLTVVDTPPDDPLLQPGDMLHWQDIHTLPPLLAEHPAADGLAELARQAGSTGKTTLLTHGGLRLFLERWTPPIHVAIFGGNYDVHPMVRLAKALGCMVSVTANLHKINRDFIKEADHSYMAGAVPTTPADAHTAFILMAHDLATDLRNLRYALNTEAPYIGLLGPKSRAIRLLEALAEDGIDIQPHQHRIFGPAGLDIGADTPDSIALSILAEIQACFGNRTGGSLRLRPGPIYD
jgi:xanthine dehydrogenase accessory factor